MIFTSIGRGQWEVIGNSGNVYVTDTENKTCTCKGFYYGQRRDKDGNKTCSHLDFFMVKER